MAGSRRWITRDEIADIYDALADQAMDSAMNEGAPDDVMHVVDKLFDAEKLRGRADQIRAIELLEKPLGSRVA